MEQLLYGSGDGIAGRTQGGWGILQATPDLQAPLARELQALASVQMPATMPQFPSADQLGQRQRRFRAVIQRDTLLLCMSAEAGIDHTKRPGNVISHCVQAERSPALRASDWYSSDDWVLPWGPRQVSQAVLPQQLGAPSGWPGVAAWLRSDPERIQRCRWVVSAGVAQLLARKPLLLKTTDASSGAYWVSAMLWMLDGDWGAGWQIYVGEDRESLARLSPKGLYIAVVTSDSAIPESRLGDVLDVTGEPKPQSDWGQVIADLLTAPDDVAVNVFAHRDELVQRLRATADGDTLTSMQALKVAWLTRQGALHLGQEDAIRELLGGVGERVRAWPELQELAASVDAPEPEDTSQGDIYGSMDDSPSDSPYEDRPPASFASGAAEPPFAKASPETPGEAPTLEPASQQLIDEALKAASRFGSLALFDTNWIREADDASPENRRAMWAVAAAASWVRPHPEEIVQAVRRRDDLVPEFVRRVAMRSLEHHGAHEALQQWLGETQWQ